MSVLPGFSQTTKKKILLVGRICLSSERASLGQASLSSSGLAEGCVAAAACDDCLSMAENGGAEQKKSIPPTTD